MYRYDTRAQDLSEMTQFGDINRINLRHPISAFGEVADLPWINDRSNVARLHERQDASLSHLPHASRITFSA